MYDELSFKHSIDCLNCDTELKLDGNLLVFHIYRYASRKYQHWELRINATVAALL